MQNQLPDTTTAQSFYHDNENYKEVLLAERCRRMEVMVLRQLVERCHADISRVRDIFSGCAGTRSAGSCMGRVPAHMFEVLQQSLGTLELYACRADGLMLRWNCAVTSSGIPRDCPQQCGRNLPERWNYLMGDLREYLYGMVEEQVEEKRAPSSLASLRLGVFSKPKAMISALGRDLLSMSSGDGAEAAPVRLSLSLERTSRSHVILEGLTLVHAVWKARDEEGWARLSEAEDAQSTASECPVVYGTFVHVKDGDGEGEEDDHGSDESYCCPVVAGSFTTRVSVGNVSGARNASFGLREECCTLGEAWRLH